MDLRQSFSERVFMHSDDEHDRLAYEGDEEYLLNPGVREFLLNRCVELKDSAQPELKEALFAAYL